MLRKLCTRLQARVNAHEERFCCVQLLDDLLQALYDHYGEVFRSDGGLAPVDLTSKYYALDDASKRIVPLPDSMEHDIESLWLGRLTSLATAVDVAGKSFAAQLKLHPWRVRDSRPLPILMIQDDCNAPTTWRTLRVLKRSAQTASSHVPTYATPLPGARIDPSFANMWLAKANVALRADDTSIWVNHALLGKLAAIWTGRPADRPFEHATLLADMKRLRAFVEAIASHEHPRLHFACIGHDRLFAYVILTSNDGSQTELSRLPVGSVG